MLGGGGGGGAGAVPGGTCELQIEGEVRPVVAETNGHRKGQVASGFFPNLPATVNGQD